MCVFAGEQIKTISSLFFKNFSRLLEILFFFVSLDEKTNIFVFL